METDTRQIIGVLVFYVKKFLSEIDQPIDKPEENMAETFLERGAPKSDIVLGFQSPYKRQFSGFAVM